MRHLGLILILPGYVILAIIKPAILVQNSLQTLVHLVLVGPVSIPMLEARIGVLGKAQFLQMLTHTAMVGSVIMVMPNMAIVV